MNRLTARWARNVTDGTAFSAAGVWTLLALLADGAGGAARAEPADAVGLLADQAAGAARELPVGLATTRGLDAALGLRTKRTLELKEAWEAGLPAAAHGVLTGDMAAGRAALEAWATQAHGRVRRPNAGRADGRDRTPPASSAPSASWRCTGTRGWC
ncbi:hypothetical protein AB0O67_17770 [Streptomyces sp. NPDC086077]|uniref:hypothetical protein n=1 Tax=Streptomyces sp. NPDC086077 TaxID=3154862 RepID=UPI00342D40CF